MPVPYEVIAAPFEAWVAPVGEPFPLIDEAPSANWSLIGTSGDRSTTEDGVFVSHSQTTEIVRGLGATGPIKVFRTEEDLIIRLTVMDITLEQYTHALNANTVTETAAGTGTAGFKTMSMHRGSSVSQNALLVRGKVSPYGDGWNTQYEVPVVFQTGTPELVFQKGTPAGLALEFTAIEDPNVSAPADRFGQIVEQNADPA